MIWPALVREMATRPVGTEISLQDIAEHQEVSLRGVTGAVGRAVAKLGGYSELPLRFTGDGEAETVQLLDPGLQESLRDALGMRT